MMTSSALTNLPYALTQSFFPASPQALVTVSGSPSCAHTHMLHPQGWEATAGSEHSWTRSPGPAALSLPSSPLTAQPHPHPLIAPNSPSAPLKQIRVPPLSPAAIVPLYVHDQATRGCHNATVSSPRVASCLRARIDAVSSGQAVRADAFARPSFPPPRASRQHLAARSQSLHAYARSGTLTSNGVSHISSSPPPSPLCRRPVRRSMPEWPAAGVYGACASCPSFSPEQMESSRVGALVSSRTHSPGTSCLRRALSNQEATQASVQFLSVSCLTLSLFLHRLHLISNVLVIQVFENPSLNFGFANMQICKSITKFFPNLNVHYTHILNFAILAIAAECGCETRRERTRLHHRRRARCHERCWFRRGDLSLSHSLTTSEHIMCRLRLWSWMLRLVLYCTYCTVSLRLFELLLKCDCAPT